MLHTTLDARGAFLDICKSFDKVWYEESIFKSQIYGINGELLNLYKNA